MNLLEKLNDFNFIHCGACGAENKPEDENCSTCGLPTEYIDIARIEEFKKTIIANKDAIKDLTDSLSEVELISLCAMCLERVNSHFEQKTREGLSDSQFDFNRSLTSRISICLDQLIDYEFGIFTDTIGNHERFTSRAITALIEGYLLGRNLRLPNANASCIIAALCRQKYPTTNNILKDLNVSYLKIVLEEFEENLRQIPAGILRSCGIVNHNHLCNLNATSKELKMLEDVLFEKYIMYDDSKETPSLFEYHEKNEDGESKESEVAKALSIMICNLEFIQPDKSVKTVNCCGILFAMLEYSDSQVLSSGQIDFTQIRSRSLKGITEVE